MRFRGCESRLGYIAFGHTLLLTCIAKCRGRLHSVVVIENKDLLQIGAGDREGPAVFRVDLGGDAKQGLNEPELPDHIALRQPPDLPFPDQMHRFVTVDRPQCPFCRPEPQTRRHALLDKSMVLLNDVV